MLDDAHAFWLREPGRGRDPAGRAARSRARGEVLVRTLRSGVSRGTETLVFRGEVPPSQYDGDARAVPGRGLPGAGEVRLPQRRRGRARARRTCVGRTVFCLLPAPDGVRRAGGRGDRRARTTCRPARAVLAGTVETAVNALWDAGAAGRRPGRRRRRRDGRLLRRAAARPASRRSTSRSSTSTRRRADVAAALGVALRAARRTPPAAATSSCTRARPPPGSSCSLDLLAPEGTVLDLSWYGDAGCGSRSAARSTRGGSASAPARSARCRPARGAAARPADRLALALDAAARPGVRRAAHRRVAASTSCPT